MVAIGSELEWLFGLEHQSTKLSANNVRSQSGNFGGWILENGHPCRLTAAFERRETSSMWCRLWKELSGEVTTATDKEYVETLARKPSRKQPMITNLLFTILLPRKTANERTLNFSSAQRITCITFRNDRGRWRRLERGMCRKNNGGSRDFFEYCL